MNTAVQPIQSGLQAAAATASKIYVVANAVSEIVGDRYLNCSDLYDLPAIHALVNDRNDLSITLSSAYRRGLVGRVYQPNGMRERFGYGKAGMTAQGATRRPREVIQPILPPDTRAMYRLSVSLGAAELVLTMLERNPGATHERLEDGDWVVTFPVRDVEGTLDLLMGGGFLRDNVSLFDIS